MISGMSRSSSSLRLSLCCSRHTQSTRSASTGGQLARAITLLVRSKQWQKALCQFHASSSHKHTGVHVSALEALVHGAQWQMALACLPGVSEPVKQTTFMHNLAMSACVRGFRWQVALALLANMSTVLVQPNAVSYNTVIASCGQSSNWTVAVNLWEAMGKTRLQPDLFSYNSMISACDKGWQWESSLVFLSMLEKSNVKGCVKSYVSAISACGKARQWRMALACMSSFSTRSLQPDAVAYNASIRTCAEAEQWQAAIAIMDSMSPSLEKDHYTYSPAMSACVKAAEWERAVSVFDTMERSGIEGNLVTYCLLMRALGQANLWEDVLFLFHDMPARRVTPDGSMYNEVLDVTCRRPEGPALFQCAMQKWLYPGLLADSLSLDLHYLSPGASILAVRWWLTEMRQRYLSTRRPFRMQIITGRGRSRREWEQAVALKPALKEFFAELKIPLTPCKNEGRLELDAQQLWQE